MRKKCGSASNWFDHLEVGCDFMGLQGPPVVATGAAVLAEGMARPSCVCPGRSCWELLSAVFLGVLGMFASGCRCDEGEPVTGRLETGHELPLLDPIEASRASGRCTIQVDWQSMLRAAPDAGASPASFDIGGAVLTPEAFAVVGHRVAEGTRNVLAVGGAGLGLVETDLGSVHGAADPPLNLLKDGVLFVLLSDNDAAGQTLQIIRVDSPFQRPHLTRGPTISAGRDESLAASFAVGNDGTLVLAWDQLDPGSSHLRIWGLQFDATTLLPSTKPRALSESSEDAEEPRIQASPRGFFLSYVALGSSSEATKKEGLVVEPHRSLRIKLLDPGLGSTQALPLSDTDQQILAYDAVGSGPNFYIAYRSGSSGSTVEGEGIDLAVVGADGVVQHGHARHELLGPGAPLLLSDAARPPWILARGTDAEVLLAEFEDVASVEFEVEQKLSERLPMARSASKLLILRSVGLDWAVEIADCAPSQPKMAPPASSVK